MGLSAFRYRPAGTACRLRPHPHHRGGRNIGRQGTAPAGRRIRSGRSRLCHRRGCPPTDGCPPAGSGKASSRQPGPFCGQLFAVRPGRLSAYRGETVPLSRPGPHFAGSLRVRRSPHGERTARSPAALERRPRIAPPYFTLVGGLFTKEKTEESEWTHA